jgi:hypothetical protein
LRTKQKTGHALLEHSAVDTIILRDIFQESPIWIFYDAADLMSISRDTGVAFFHPTSFTIGLRDSQSRREMVSRSRHIVKLQMEAERIMPISK